VKTISFPTTVSPRSTAWSSRSRPPPARRQPRRLSHRRLSCQSGISDGSVLVAPAANAAPRLLPPPPDVVLPIGDKTARWQALRELVLNHPVCQAHVRPGKQVVFGVGNLDARILFVGEAPGAEEEQQGEPFVGPAGSCSPG